MNSDSIKIYNTFLKGTGKGHRQKAHQKKHSAFSAYLFQIIGNKAILSVSIQFPLCSAAQPAEIITQFMHAVEQEKATEDYKKRVQISERLTEERKDL